LYAATREVAWEDHVSASGTIAVDATGTNSALRNTQFSAVRVKDAIVDRLREVKGERPGVDRDSPDVRVNLVVAGERGKLAIDLSGQPLHRRGYRQSGVQVTAPMKETLAASVLEIAGWRAIAAQGGAFLDPLCGSGTLVIEAAMAAADIAPGLFRSGWGFERWSGHDESAWTRLLDEADGRCERGLESLVPIEGSDRDGAAVDIAVACARRAGLGRHVTFEVRPLSQAAPPSGARYGLIASNPPYGERMGDSVSVATLHAELSVLLRGAFIEWDAAFITSDESIERGMRMHSQGVTSLMNGRIPASVYVFRGGGQDRAAPATDPAAEAFRNRLLKMGRHFGGWARRTGVTCYRVYDADLPDYNVAIDLYQGAGSDEGLKLVHLAEYAPPAEVDPARARERLEVARTIAAEVFEVPVEDVFVKRRERQRGSAQYERVDERSVTATVAEGGLLFEVNLSDYLDTGLFLDHRETRARVRELATDARFLNLFAYTGSVTAYAAAGGAVTTTTVDLSQTYLDWARRNLAMNGLDGAAHTFVRADVLEWVGKAAAAGERYDLIFCDPPTFSNSKRMEGTWDVQRDHVALLHRAGELLAPDGTLLFSCNRRGFELEHDALSEAGFAVRDITRRTIPKDFDRPGPAPHRCWILRRA
jgi:23S rRNA (guanine2445-N2)-methyltransferase / 23S rRNA (guanine2069-N7)-methyltransferase